jgi:hypothetical protein
MVGLASPPSRRLTRFGPDGVGLTVLTAPTTSLGRQRSMAAEVYGL